MGSSIGQARAWWKESSVYQIYPASFQDSTGSGVGDLRGITSRVPYLKDLGVDIVWLSPIFKSPQVDMGYDISDYKAIDPRYGDNEDLKLLKERLHEEGMKLVLDLVVNHTSDQHEWFKESRKSKDNPYRDWYIWKPAKYDSSGNRQPPNNWKSLFEGNAWEYDETTDEYYLHLFCKEQPDLNWENPAVREAVHDIMRYHLGNGADGFRLDVINFVSKDQAFPDSDDTVLPGHEYYARGPRLHEYLKEIGSILQEYNAFSVGEMPCVHDERELIKAVGADRGELSMIFHFELVDIDHGEDGKFSPGTWSLAKLKSVVDKWQQFMIENNGWNALYLENHDQPRSVSRYMHDSPECRDASAKTLAIFLGLQSGTPFIYQGQELGMTNVPEDWTIEEYKDVEMLNHWKICQNTMDSGSREQVIKEYQKKGRDNARTPMQWDDSPNAGFTTGTPWIRVNDNFKEINVGKRTSDATSVFHYWRTVLSVRKAFKDIFVYGDFSLVDRENDKIFAYRRRAVNGDAALVICNFSAERLMWKFSGSVREVVIGSRPLSDFEGGEVELNPCEGLLVFLADM